jgi:hypothetical protein
MVQCAQMVESPPAGILAHREHKTTNTFMQRLLKFAYKLPRVFIRLLGS